MTAPQLTWKRFDELSAPELYEVLAFRQAVFVVEQRSPYLDLDGLDGEAMHLVGRDADGALVAYARVFSPCAAHAVGKIGRVVIAAGQRGAGLGRHVMQVCLDWLEARHPGVAVQVSAQAHLRAFYGSLGFVDVSDEYDDGGVMHVDMRRG